MLTLIHSVLDWDHRGDDSRSLTIIMTSAFNLLTFIVVVASPGGINGLLQRFGQFEPFPVRRRLRN